MLEKLRYVFALLILCFGVLTTAAQNDSRDPSDAIIGLSVHPTLPHYAIVRQSGNIEIFNYETSALVDVFSITIPFRDQTIEDPLGFKVQAIEYSPDGAQLAISVSDYGYNGLVSIIDLQTKQIRRAHNSSYLDRINDMSWNSEGTKLVLALQYGYVDQLIDSSIEILDVTTGEIEVTLVDRSSINNETASSVDWSRSGLIAYAQGKKLTIWDAVTVGEMSIEVENEIHDITWSPLGDRVAMLSAERTIHIWTVEADDLTLLYELSPVTTNLYSRVMTWIDDSILAVNFWTNIEIWNIAKQECNQLIETDHFIFGIGTLSGGQVLYAGPREVVAVDLDQLGDCVGTESIDNS